MSKEEKEVERELLDRYERWELINTYGGSDPNWEDGCNMNLVRNHIIYYKRQMEELNFFPEAYYRETPPEVANTYMARAEEIREHAKQSLAIYKRDNDYMYLVNNKHKLNKKDAQQISLNNVIGYVTGLEMFIEEDNLVRMRIHENPERYQESFKRCRKGMENILGELKEPKQIKLGQMSIFDLRNTAFDIGV